LREIAGETERGFYLPLRPKTMETLYEKGLAPLPKSDSAEKLVKRYYEQFHWPLGLAILLLVIEMFFPERKRAPRQAPSRQLAKPLATAAVSALVLMAFLQSAKASSSTALHDYKAGEYKKALRQYKYLLQEQPDDPRLHFNAGAAAYRSQQFDEAEKHFDEALKSPDLELQEKAYYNRGNTRYWLGDQQADPQKKTAAWQEAVKDFESSLKLNPADADAKHNQDYVRQLLEELKQQQQQRNKSDQDQKQDQQQQQQQASQQEQQNQQNQQSQNEQQQQQGQQEQQQAQQQPQPEEQNQPSESRQPEQQQQQAAEQNEQEQQAAGKQDEQHQEEEAAAAAAPGQMTPEQARQLLDSQKGEEQMMPIRPEGKPHNTDRPFRDW
jgi:Ca-activated chloride channel family protein